MSDKNQLNEDEERQKRIEAAENLISLLRTLKKFEKEQAKMTPEEKKRNEWAAWDGDEMLYKY
ncbi:hypothetical protein IKQ74_02295 [Candidatus Saccharibacteria bacterium]|nr:hypothetical protein [Candidatus Saccharibacteria bacterium]